MKIKKIFLLIFVLLGISNMIQSAAPSDTDSKRTGSLVHEEEKKAHQPELNRLHDLIQSRMDYLADYINNNRHRITDADTQAVERWMAAYGFSKGDIEKIQEEAKRNHLTAKFVRTKAMEPGVLLEIDEVFKRSKGKGTFEADLTAMLDVLFEKLYNKLTPDAKALLEFRNFGMLAEERIREIDAHGHA